MIGLLVTGALLSGVLSFCICIGKKENRKSPLLFAAGAVCQAGVLGVLAVLSAFWIAGKLTQQGVEPLFILIWCTLLAGFSIFYGGLAGLIRNLGFRSYIAHVNKTNACALLMAIGLAFGFYIAGNFYLIYAEGAVVINEVCSDNFEMIADKDGRYSDYIELYNPTPTELSLKGYSISNDEQNLNKYILEDIKIKGRGYVLIFMNGGKTPSGEETIEAPFKLSTKGERLFFSSREGKIIDSVEVPGLDYDTAYARTEDGGADWERAACTPLKKNDGRKMGSSVILSQESGFYTEPFYLEMTAEEGRKIYYTLDGSRPNADSHLYTEPLYIEDVSDREDVYSDRTDISYLFPEAFEKKVDKATVIRAIALDNEGNGEEEASGVYFVDFEDKYGYEGIQIVSFLVEPDDLFGDEKGIYVLGDAYQTYLDNGGDPEYMNADANYLMTGKEWEREAVVTYFNKDKTPLFTQSCGIRIQGASKRFTVQKSFTINARYKYGEPYFKENIFGKDYQMNRLVMKNSMRYIPRETFPYELVEEKDIGLKDYDYCALFINGEYWGLYLVEEKYNSSYFEQHYGVDRDNLILVKGGLLDEGTKADMTLYGELLEFAQKVDLSIDENYDKICEIMDIQSFIDFTCTQVYIANMDFSSLKNCYVWRARETKEGKYEDGKWRWLLYDLDFSQGGEEINSYKVNSFSTEMPWCYPVVVEDTLMKSLMKNDKFKEQFKAAFLEMAATNFEASAVLERIDRWEEILREPMTASMQRFSRQDYQEEDFDLNTMKVFYQNRFAYISAYLEEEFQ